MLIIDMIKNKHLKVMFWNGTCYGYLMQFSKLIRILVNRAESVSRLKYLMTNILMSFIRWEDGIKSQKCHICGLNENKVALDESKQSKLNESMRFVKWKCDHCDTYFHLRCILDKKRESQSSGAGASQCFDLVKRVNAYMCFECDCVREKSEQDELQKLLNKVEQSKELNSIEVNNKQLRLNKTRIQQ